MTGRGGGMTPLPEFLHVYARCRCGLRSDAPMDPDVAETWTCRTCLTQPDLFLRPAHGFGGATFDPELDDARLGKQLAAVLAVLREDPERYWTLAELEARTGFPQASISARLRDLRKPDLNFPVPRRRRSEGTFEYALTDEAPNRCRESTTPPARSSE